MLISQLETQYFVLQWKVWIQQGWYSSSPGSDLSILVQICWASPSTSTCRSARNTISKGKWFLNDAQTTCSYHFSIDPSQVYVWRISYMLTSCSPTVSMWPSRWDERPGSLEWTILGSFLCIYECAQIPLRYWKTFHTHIKIYHFDNPN